MLVARGVWTSKGEAIAFAVGYVEGIKTGRRMFESARQVVKDTPKNIRINLYDRVFAAMVDEPKYFKYKKNEETGEYELDYDAYLDTDTGFSAKYLDFKKNHKDEPDAWYLRKQLSYSWDKTPAPVCEEREEGKCIRYKCVKDDQGNCLRYETAITEGWLSEGRPAKERDGEKFDSYLEMKLENAPQKISIRAQKLPLSFLWRCGHSVCPGILPNPYAGISRIVVSPSKSFGATVRKMPFRIFPYFISERKPDETEEDEEKRKEISHKSKIRIAGSLMSGFEVRLVE